VQVNCLLNKFEEEIVYHENPVSFDHDLAFVVDSIARIICGEIYESRESELSHKASTLLQRAGEIYPSILTYTPVAGQKPNPDQIIQEIDAREAANSQDDPPEVDVP